MTPATREATPTISVIIPVHNGQHFLDRCLDGLASSTSKPHEVIVVDDASTDGGAARAQARGAVVLRRPMKSGPGGARNHGACVARGDVLLFVDADVVVHPDTVARVAAAFRQQPDVVALFGSYDDTPAEPNFASQYKNLYHHFVHQHGHGDATTFWAGCGAVRRDAFLAIGGFDQQRYPDPSIEDIELGYRLRRSGHRILLDKAVQATHLKRWTLGSMLRADIFSRAVPWSRLILETGTMVNDLNLRLTERFSAALVGLSMLMVLAGVIRPPLLLLAPVVLAPALALNRHLYGFFFRRKGLAFMFGALAMHLLYYVYSAATFVCCSCARRLARKPGPHAEPRPLVSSV
jgi:glycosyltransferase involved in cell wall biosynthesis